MDMSDATEGASFWQSHIAAWQQSGLTQKAYCEQQELRYSTFGYWVRKLRRAAEPATKKKGAGFVPVIPATVQPTGLTLSLPNGLTAWRSAASKQTTWVWCVICWGCWHEVPQACLRPRDRFWDIPVPKIDSAFDNLFVPQPSWSPSTTQQLRKLVAAPYLAPI
ncbi:IS66 family insertion sequence element accessory protein TnpA [Thiolapillus sp.]|uniref:IS66 family insertion sequence element accessory protein TnpA n=1 Tax=Thiolapillus sp. TaxID=2017437 RepID=UPI003AF4AF24